MGQWNTWADVPQDFKQETYDNSQWFWDNPKPEQLQPFVGEYGQIQQPVDVSTQRAGNSWGRRIVPGMAEPTWNAPGTTQAPGWQGGDAGHETPGNLAGDPLSYYYDGGHDDRFALQRHPDGSFSQVEIASDKDFFEDTLKAGVISLGGAYLGGSLMGGAGGAAGGVGSGELAPLVATDVGSFGGVTGVTAGEGAAGAAAGGGLMGGGGLTAGQVATGGSMASSLIPGISNETLFKVGGGLLGGALGGKDSTQTANREPWGPAQEWLKSNLQTGKSLQEYYQQNPFNQQQKTSYQNLFNGIDGFNQSMPGLLNFANNAMGSSYQRQRGGAPGSGAGYGGAVQPGGLLRGPGAFAAPQMQANAPIDWNAINPFKRG